MLQDFVAVDIETTGLSPEKDRIIEIGAARYVQGQLKDTFSELIQPGRTLSERIVELTGITDEMLAGAGKEQEVLRAFLTFADGWTLLGHNLPFDYSFLKTAAIREQMPFDYQGIDTLVISRVLHRDFTTRSLGAMCRYYEIQNEHAHRALDDARAAAELYQCLMKRFGKEKPELFEGNVMNCRLKKQEPITPKQKKYLLGLAAQFQLTIEQELDSLSKSEASRMIDGILSSYGYQH